MVAVFFGFQRYIVHTPDGVRLDIPFLRGILDEIPEIPCHARPKLIFHLSVEPEEEDAEPLFFRSLFVSGQNLEALPDESLISADFQPDAILVAMTDETGLLWWESESEMAVRFGLSGEGEPGLLLEDMDEELTHSALLFGFHNQLLASRNPPVALNGREDWLDPRNPEVRAYIIDLAVELGRMGFDEIVLIDFSFPPGYPDADDALILTFLRDMVRALGAIDVVLSVMTREADWREPGDEEDIFRQELSLFADIAFRFYCLLEPEALENPAKFETLMAAVASALGEDALHRFVPAGPGNGPEAGNWLALLE